MKLITSLLLGSTAGILAVSGASAADLPSRSKGPAVEYVRICDTYGAGYFYIPGTDTCLKISGYARADYAVRNVNNLFGVVGGQIGALGLVALRTPADFVLPVPAPAVFRPGTDRTLQNVNGISAASRNSTGFSALGGLELDARSSTAWGTLRGFIRYEISSANGLLGGNAAALDKAFVQFAGITAGRAQSFFDFYGDAYPLDNSRGSDSTTHMLAYTASFGGGFSATVSIEDPVVRRGGIGSNVRNGGLLNGTFASAAYGGSKLPDLVAQLRVEQSWGKAQLSGAVHEVNTISATTIGASSARRTGFAVQAGIAINLPSLAAGDEIYVQGAYARGAKSYLGLGTLGGATNGLLRNEVDAVAIARTIAAPGSFVASSYSLELGRGYNIQAGLKHYWSPNVKQYIYASYTTWNYGSQSRANFYNLGGFGNGKELEIGTGIVWTPVKNLDLTFDLEYARLTQNVNSAPLLGVNQTNQLTVSGADPSATNAAIKKNGSSFTGRLRIQRSF